MNAGELLQVDTPLALYDRPANLFVAGFIGSPAMNLLEATTPGDGTAEVDGYGFQIDREAAAASTGKVTLGIRPESWEFDEDGTGYPVRVAVVEELGADSYLYGTPQDASPDLQGGVIRQIIARVPGRGGLERGKVVHLKVQPENVHVFDTVTGARLTT